MGYGSEGGGEEKPGQGIMDEKKGPNHDLCRI